MEDSMLSAALDAAPEPIALVHTTRPQWPLVYCNEAFCALTGYGREQLVDRDLGLLLPSMDAFRSAIDLMERSPSGEHELQLRRQDGSLFWTCVRAAPVSCGGGDPTHLVVTCRDVTLDRERAETLRGALAQAERANWAKSRLIAVAGHDLRQPLQTIVAALELLDRTSGLDERGRRLLTHAETAAADLDEELRALAQVADVKRDLTPKFETLSLDGVVDQVVRAWRPRAEHKGLELRVVRSGLAVRSDRTMLRTIVRNLLGNAVKYTAQGRVLVGARRQGEMVSLEIWDTGPGVSPHKVSRIFDAFERADAPGEGLGLGLWIVQRTAEFLGHRVVVRSRPQQGSCFSLCLSRDRQVDDDD